MAVQMRCGRCDRSVSFEQIASDEPLFCPRCKGPLAAAPKHEAAPWWIHSGSQTTKIDPVDAVVPRPPEGVEPFFRSGMADSRLAIISVALGGIGFGMAWLPQLGLQYAALGMSGLGLSIALAILGRMLLRRRAGCGLLLAAAFVNGQALAVTLYFLRTPISSEAVDGAANETERVHDNTTPQTIQTAAPSMSEWLKLLDRDKLSLVLGGRDLKGRRDCVFAVGEVGRRLLDTVGHLADRLDDEDAAVRAAAAEALGKLGPLSKGAYPPLMHASKSDVDRDVRRAAQSALERIGPLGPTDATFLTFCLKYDGNANFRASTAQTLLTIGMLPDDALHALHGALKDGDVRVRVFAAQTLWINRREAGEVVEVLRAAVRESKDGAVRAGAAYALGSIGKAARVALRDLRELLQREEDGEARLRAAEALYSIAEDVVGAVPELRKLLGDKSPSVRGLAAEALGRIGARAASAVEELRGLLVKDEDRVRASAAFALGGIGKDAKSAVPDLIAVLRTSKGEVREQIVAALGAIGPDAVESAPALIEMLHQESDSVRARAAFALGSMGRGARKAVPSLNELLKKSRDSGERLILAQALWRIERDGEEIVPVLLDLLKERDVRLRLATVEVLGEMGSAARLAVPTLREVHGEAIDELRRAIEQAQEQIGTATKDDLDDLLKAISSKKPSYRLAAAQALLPLAADAGDAVAALVEALKVHDPEFRLAVVAVLGAVGEKAGEATPALVELLAVKDVEFQAAVLEALAAIGPAALKAVPVLIRSLKSEEHLLRANAAFALGSIGREPTNAAKLEQQRTRDALKEALLPLKDAALHDKDIDVRLYAAQALYSLTRQTDPTVNVLKTCLNEKDSIGIRVAAAEALADIGPRCRDADKEIVPLLVKLWKTDREEVRRAAFEALKKIAPAEVAPGRR